MDMSHTQLIWADKPGCARPAAEVWIGETHLWFVIFVDDHDNTLKIEIHPPPMAERTVKVIDFIEVERLVETAKRELLMMAPPPSDRKRERRI